jgi:hypothetical protein
VNGFHDETYDQKYEGDFEMLGDQEGDFEGDFEADFEADFEGGFDNHEGPFSEGQELELAAELLGVSEEAELDQFLGKLFKKVAPVVGKILNTQPGQALKGLLKDTAKKSLPLLGQAVGGYYGGPKWDSIGGQLGNVAGQIFGLELEGMSPEDGELEVAKRFVRLAGDAASQVAQTAGSGAPQQVAKSALAAAARTHAPGLLRAPNGTSSTGSPSGISAGTRRCACGNAGGGASYGGASYGDGRPARGQSGRWFRRGRQIVLVGL